MRIFIMKIKIEFCIHIKYAACEGVFNVKRAYSQLYNIVIKSLINPGLVYIDVLNVRIE